MPARLRRAALSILHETRVVYLTLLKILVPALIIVKVLESIGFTQWLATLLAPLMGLLGLPEELSIVWAATLLTNIYTGMAIFYNLSLDQALSVAQVTVLGTLMVVGHGLPVEGAVARRAGVPWWLTLVLRVGGALILGMILHHSYQTFDWLQQDNTLVWQPDALDTSLSAWLWAQCQTLITIFFVILALITLLRGLRAIGVERLLHALLFPLLRLLGIGRDAASTAIIGITLGLSFGGGLLIRDAESGRLSPRDAFLTLAFLGLCHSLIEDTLLVMLLGAHLSGILWARLALAFLVIGVLARLPISQRKSEHPEAGRADAS
ncbi:nucleoside recognition domain-containing protein [Marinobacter sp. JSM 1782161]|uniref:nucleoside recognition domain-containing protein n=1 Tax=Marinobacter sp. JSM 1782161 TaxID=2685906 RepID=UPI001402A787|nr:nucleoside recognition domain-containing protein [Marinobacter sp. JSM 1782161]